MSGVQPVPIALGECGDLARRVFSDGLQILADPSDRRLFGLRRELYRQIATQVGAIRVGCHTRLMQFSEIDSCLNDLEFVGVIENASMGEVVEVRLCA